MESCDLSAFELSRLIRQRKISALEAAESSLQRIAAVDGKPGSIDGQADHSENDEKIHAFITLTAEKARQQARNVDQQLKEGMDPGPLAGVPVTVKDIFCVKDTPSTAASRILANFIAPYTATPVERMQAAGAVMLGKVNLDEFTYGSSNESSAFQPTPRNPWDTSPCAGRILGRQRRLGGGR